MSGFRWPSMERRLRIAFRRDSTLAKAMRRERKRRRVSYDEAASRWCNFFMVAFGVAFLARGASVESSIAGGAAIALGVSLHLAFRFIVALWGTGGHALFHHPIPGKDLVDHAFRRACVGRLPWVLVLLLCHVLPVRTHGACAILGAVALSLAQWVVAAAFAVFLVRRLWLRWTPLGGPIAVVAGVVILWSWASWGHGARWALSSAAILVPTGGVAWACHGSAGLFAALIAIPPALLLATMSRSLRGLVRVHEEVLIEALGSAAPPRDAPVRVERVALDRALLPNRNVPQAIAARLILSPRETLLLDLFLGSATGGRLAWPIGWAIAALITIVGTVGAGQTVDPRLCLALASLLTFFAGVRFAGFVPIPAGSVLSVPFVHYPVGLWEIARIALKTALVRWALSLPILAGYAWAGLVGARGVFPVDAAKVAFATLALIPAVTCLQVQCFFRQDTQVKLGVGFLLLVLSGLPVFGMFHPMLRQPLVECLVALAVLSLLAWLYLEVWSRRGRADYVFKYTECLQ